MFPKRFWNKFTQVAATQPLQSASRTGYFQPNAPRNAPECGLGSVRQMTDSSSVISSYSAGETVYGYTGEMQDSNGMVNLRARVYLPHDGRFLSRDTWAGNDNQPMSYNKWLYTYANPINKVDPSGHNAIWLTNTNTFESMGLLGHTSLLISNSTNSQWYYFFYGAKNYNPLGDEAKEIYESRIERGKKLNPNYRFLTPMQYVNQ